MIILASGALISISIYLLLELNIMRRVFGLILLGSAINLVLLISGRLSSTHPAFIESHHVNSANMTNPLPQALILTAIVIGFGLLAFLTALLKKLLEHNNA